MDTVIDDASSEDDEDAEEAEEEDDADDVRDVGTAQQPLMSNDSSVVDVEMSVDKDDSARGPIRGLPLTSK